MNGLTSCMRLLQNIWVIANVQFTEALNIVYGGKRTDTDSKTLIEVFKFVFYETHHI